eukprot:7343836-Prymnesium_polylepis.1
MCRKPAEARSPINPACSLTLRHAERRVPPHHTYRLTPVKMSDRVGSMGACEHSSEHYELYGRPSRPCAPRAKGG